MNSINNKKKMQKLQARFSRTPRIRRAKIGFFFFGSFVQVFLYLIGVNIDSKGFNEIGC